MAWTNPRDWTAGEVVTAAIMNTHLRDNLLSIFNGGVSGTPGWFKFGRMTSDQTKNANTTLINLTNLTFTVAANEVWIFLCLLRTATNQTANIKFDSTVPSGAAGIHGVIQQNTTAQQGTAGTTIGTITVGVGDNTFGLSMLYWGVVVNGANAGAVQAQFAQNTSNASNTVVYTHSSIIAVRIA